MRTGDTLQLPVLSWTAWTTSAVYDSAETVWEDVPQDVQVLLYVHPEPWGPTYCSGIQDADTYSMPGFGAATDKTGLLLPDDVFAARELEVRRELWGAGLWPVAADRVGWDRP